MKKTILSLFALALVVILGSSTACNDTDHEKVASHKVIGEANKHVDESTPVAKTVVSNKVEISESLKKSKMVLISTNFGDIKIALYDETPLHRDNFLELVEEGFYEDLLFHRVIKSFMVQGGDPQSRGADPKARLGSGGPGYTVPAEFNTSLIHKKGALAAARRGGPGNPDKESSGCQFYMVQGQSVDDTMLDQIEGRINSAKLTEEPFAYTAEQRAIYKEVGGTPFLDMDYTVFGEIVEGLDVMDAIAATKTAPGDRPVEDVKMNMKIVKK